jgi:NTE family protein
MMEAAPLDSTAMHSREPVLVDLALQGGGSRGAFTWGVLDRLLQESWLRVDGISGTSAGAMNAVVLVSGYEKGGTGRSAGCARRVLATRLAFRPVRSHSA